MSDEAEAYGFYKHVMTTYSKGELAHIAATHIATDLIKKRDKKIKYSADADSGKLIRQYGYILGI